MSAPQLPLALSPPRRRRFANFVPGTNQALVATLRSALEPGQWYVLTGPGGVGKSHLAVALEHAWREAGNAVRYIPGDAAAAAVLLASVSSDDACAAAVIIEDIDRLGGDPDAERALFNALNQLRSRRAMVLMTARSVPEFTLPDLASRVAQAARLRLNTLDDDALAQLTTQLVADFDLVVGRGVASYVQRHGPRAPAALVGLFERVARRAAAERRVVSIPLLRECLADCRD